MYGFDRSGVLSRLANTSDAHAKMGHEHPCGDFGDMVDFGREPKLNERWSFGLNGRVVTTSHVRELTWTPQGIIFQTSNSLYRLDFSPSRG
jgi:hypothetical protein